MAALQREPVLVYVMIFIIAGLGAILLPMVPITAQSTAIPTPDWLSLLVLAYICRRPRFTPLIVIAGLFLLRDFLHILPVGLWSLLMIIVTEFIRANKLAFQDYSFWIEWLLVTLFLSAATVLQHILLLISLSPKPSFYEALSVVVISALAYPLVIFFVSTVLRVKKRPIGDGSTVGMVL